MAINRSNQPVAYGVGAPTITLAPLPLIVKRDPTARDHAELGSIWCNPLTDGTWMLTSIVANEANWEGLGSTGGPFTSLTIDPGDLTVVAGDVIVTAGDLTVTAGLTTLGGGVAIVGDVTITGDFDLEDSGSISLTSTNNAARAIYLHANGGTSETIQLHSDQGTGVASVELLSDVGGVTLTSGLASADAINLAAASGGVDIDGALLVSITSTRNNAQAILLEATLGGIDILASGAGAAEDIDIIATGSSVNISATESAADSITIISTAGGIDISASGASAGEDIDITATGSSVNITATENDANAIVIRTNGGTSEKLKLLASQGTGADSVSIVSTAGGLTLSGGLATADAVNILSSDVGGGVDIDAGTAGIAIDSTGAFSIDGAAASNVTVTGAGIDLLLASALGSVLIESTEDAALAIKLHANGGTSETIQLHSDLGTGVGSVNLLSDVGGITFRATGLASADAINLEAVAGGIDADAALQINIASSQAAVANSVRIVASAADGGMDLDAGTGGITIDSTGAFSIDGAAASNVTVTGAGIDLTLASVLGSVLVSSTEDAANAVQLYANGGTSETIRLRADQGTGVASIDILSDVGGITLTSGLASADAINLAASAGGVDIDGALQVNIASSQNAADSIVITSSAGGIDILAAGAGAGEDIDIIATGSSVNINSTENAADSVVISSTNGGIDILAVGAGAGEDIDIVATGSSVNITATEAAADAIVLNASNGAGGIDLTTGGGSIDLSSAGFVSMVPATATSASPTASATINARVFKATFTGFTTASAGTQDFTITNSSHSAASDGVIVTVANAGTNDAKMTMTRVNVQTAGTIVVSTTNNGAAALNGNVVITGWVID